jgi:N-acetylglutamate synthase-like GNAT family acetyltransferase
MDTDLSGQGAIPFMDIRSATAEDETDIKRMVRAARLDPTKIYWQNFVIAEIDGKIAGIGQVRQHADCRELGSMVTLKPHRGQGVARAIITELEKRNGLPLYLFCPGHRQTFYALSGYEAIGYGQLPRTLKLKMLLPMLFRIFGFKIITMVKR